MKSNCRTGKFCHTLKDIVCNWKVSEWLKLLYEIYYLSALIYGMEIRMWNRRDICRLQPTEMEFLQNIKN